MPYLTGRLQEVLGCGYRVVRELGGGAMSRVFLAEELALHRQVVVKVLPPEMSAGVSGERFRQEIQLVAALQHPHIVPLLSAGAADDLLFYIMPYLQGESLRARLARERELPIHEVVRILREVLDALAAAHERGVVHRDIKPDNVLLTGRHAVVTDSGVAKAVSDSTHASNLISVGIALGTPAYMAPEQAAGDPDVDHRADIYAVGVLAYEMLCGRPPFQMHTARETIAAQLTLAPEPCTTHRAAVPRVLNDIVMQCLAKRPADRPQSADDLLALLNEMADPGGAFPPISAAEARRALRLHQPLRLVGALALLAALVTLSARVARRGEGPGPVVVVSPFIDRTGDPSLDHIAEGLRLALAGELAQRARVRLRTDPIDSRTVVYVVEGSVYAVGDSLRVQVTVTDANAGTVRWTGSPTYPRRELPALPLGLTTEIIRALDLSMSPRGERRVGRHASGDTAAYSQWLRALALESRRQRDALLGCVAATDSAVANDPMFAEAFALRARCLNVLSFVDTVAPERSFGLAKQSAARALAIDPGLARAHAELAYAVAHHDWDWEEAERQYARALQLDGATPQMHADLAWVLSWRRRFDEAFRHMTQAEALAPDDPHILLRMSMILHFAGRHQEAVNLAYRVIAMDSSSLFAWDRLHWAYQGLGRLDSAVVAAERASAIGGPADVRRRGALGYAYARHGRRDEAQAILRELAERAGAAPVPPTAIAWVHLGVGEHEEAIHLLERGYRTRDGDMVTIATLVPWRALARHPRFQRLVASMRLPQRRDD